MRLACGFLWSLAYQGARNASSPGCRAGGERRHLIDDARKPLKSRKERRNARHCTPLAQNFKALIGESVSTYGRLQSGKGRAGVPVATPPGRLEPPPLARSGPPFGLPAELQLGARPADQHVSAPLA